MLIFESMENYDLYYINRKKCLQIMSANSISSNFCILFIMLKRIWMGKGSYI